MRIRDLAPGDWERVWPFFDEIVADGETYAYPPGLTSEAARALWVQPPPHRTVVAVDGDTVDGDTVLASATMGPNRPGRGSHVATGSFMVAPAARGRGVGRALGEELLAWARANGFRAVQFNAVVETNASAVAL